jgi:membrane protein implicated in regulation of membrane protease activity
MLVLAYMALAVLGTGYVLVASLLGHVSDLGSSDGAHADGGGAHSASDSYGVEHGGHGTASAGDAYAASFHFPFFSPLALATLTGSMGALGLLAHYGFGLVDNSSLLVAVPGAVALTYGVTYVAWRIVGGASSTSTIRAADLAGADGEVTTPIPAGGLGEVVAMVAGERFSAPAREAQGRELPRGALVRVVRFVGGTLLVEVPPDARPKQ